MEVKRVSVTLNLEYVKCEPGGKYGNFSAQDVSKFIE